MTLLFAATLAAYLVACALYLTVLGRGQDRLAKVARTGLLVAFGLHTADIGLRCVHGLHPIADTRESVAFLAWIAAGAYLLVSRRGRIGSLAGAFVTPIVVVLLVLARFTPASASPAALGVLGRLHVSLAVLGVGMFTLAAALALLYLLEDGQLRSKRLGVILHKGVPLTRLDAYGHRCVSLGFPIFTAALITGAMWVARLPGARAAGIRPEYVLAVITWLSFASLLVARSTAGWRGRRAAIMTLIGFGAALGTVFIYVARAALRV